MILSNTLKALNKFFKDNNYSTYAYLITILLVTLGLPIIEVIVFTFILHPYPLFLQLPIFGIMLLYIVIDLFHARNYLMK